MYVQKKSELDIESERLDTLSSSLDALKQDCRERECSITKAKHEITHIEDKLIQNQKETALLDQYIRQDTESLSALEAERGENERRLNMLNISERDNNAKKEVLLREISRLEARLSSLHGEYESLQQKLWDDYELTYSDAERLRRIIPDDERKAANTRLSVLRDAIKKLGTVNVNAIEEYLSLRERYEFLTAQVNDLEESKTKLSGIINKLEEQMRTAFTQSVKAINENFKDVFSELFGGGSAHIVICSPEDILQSDIEIVVQPPGKIIKNLVQLSGGEQAFVAIALYLAMIKLNPTPFCIFDEVDTSLDDVNVDRLAEYLKRCTNKTQFIMITHRRGTMELADRLYGITMHEKGVSRFLIMNTDSIAAKL
jgi:chromosome segregation protein